MATQRSAIARPATTPAKKASQAARPVRKTVARPRAQPAQAAPATEVKPASRPKEDKPRKPKMVRDSFTMPKEEYAVIEVLKDRAAKAGRPAKKSELLRAGVALLERLSAKALVSALQALPAVKTGRPAKA